MSGTGPSEEHRKLMAEALVRLQQAQAKVRELEAERSEPLAIVGMGCRFPGGADSPSALWARLREGRDLMGPIPADRWDVDRYYHPDPDHPGTMACRAGGFIDRPADFDPQFFGIAPREAETMDPQQRLLLETAWEALEHAAIAPDSLYGSSTGVYVGISTTDWAHHMTEFLPREQIAAAAGTGIAHSAAAGRISYALGLTGPAVALNTACSSSLVALHAACEGLRRRDCDLALVGGVNLILSPLPMVVFSQAHMLAPDGRCKSFSDSADGYGRGEGAGVVVLARRSDALTKGYRILAEVHGSAINQDGASSGLTVPNGPAQSAVIRSALNRAHCRPEDVDYVEAHGTGTALGDPLEMGALETVFAEGRAPERPLRIGSIKTNLGHLEAAAGMAALIKSVLQLQHREIVPHLHAEPPSRHIPWDRLPFQIPKRCTPWASTSDAKSLRTAGLSSFGFTGTNVHVVLREASSPATDAEVSAGHAEWLLPLSARSPAALNELLERYRDHLQKFPDTRVADICATAGAGRSHFEERAVIRARSHAELSAGIDALLANQPSPDTWRGKVTPRRGVHAFPSPVDWRAVAEAYVDGAALDWRSLYACDAPRPIALPTYPFQRRRYWMPERAPDQTSELLHELRWNPAPLPSSNRESHYCVIGGEFAPALVDSLHSEPYDPSSNPAPGSARHVVVLHALGVRLGDDTETLLLEEQIERALRPLLELAQQLSRQTAPGTRITVVTRGAQSRGDGDGHVDPIHAAVWAFTRVLALEHPEWLVQRVDTDGEPQSASTQAGAADESLFAQALSCNHPDLLLRDHSAFLPQLVSVPEPTASPNLSGAFLVTGGLGGLGSALARWLLQRGAEQIVLVGRNPERFEELRADLTSDAARVSFEPCDVTRAAECSNLARTLESRGIQLSGIVHAAGVVDDGLITDLSWERVRAVLAPKTLGAWNLHRLSLAHASCKFVAISSLAALLGNPGQSHYAAANGFLDGLAAWRAQRDCDALSVQFGPWSEVGMAARIAPERDPWIRLGVRRLSAERALEAFGCALQRPSPRIAIADADWGTFLRVAPAEQFPELRDLAPSSGPERASAANLRNELAELAQDARDVRLEQLVRSALATVLRLPADEVDLGKPLTQLGLDSLMGIELRNRIQRDLGLAVPMTVLLGDSSGRDAAHWLAAQLSSLAPSEPDEALLEELESLSEEEALRLLEGEDE